VAERVGAQVLGVSDHMRRTNRRKRTSGTSGFVFEMLFFKTAEADQSQSDEQWAMRGERKSPYGGRWRQIYT
jgi:hypothetical protein